MGERLQCQKNYFCSFLRCKAKFNKLWKLDAHQCKHTGLKPFACESCDKSFCTRYQLSRHGLRHSGEKPHKCLADGCSEVFVTSASMKNHMFRVHLHQRRLYHCDHLGCEKRFRKRHQLHTHKYEHTRTPYFHCTVDGCAKSFISRGKLKRHEKMHQGYSCGDEFCLFVASTWMQYLKHRKIHTARLPCNTCKKQFTKKWFVHQHVLNVHSKGKNEFICPKKGCDKKFTQSFNLESHVLGEHEGKKPFDCAVCGKSFAMLESLWRHGVVHDPERKKIKKLRPNKNQPWQAAQQKAKEVSHHALMDKLAAGLENVKC